MIVSRAPSLLVWLKLGQSSLIRHFADCSQAGLRFLFHRIQPPTPFTWSPLTKTLLIRASFRFGENQVEGVGEGAGFQRR